MKTHVLEKDYSIKISSNIIEHIYPEFVFLPIYDKFKLKVKNNDLIKKNQIILAKNEVVVKSPVSGRVVGAKFCLTETGNKEKCVVIENDFKEKIIERGIVRKSLKTINRLDFLDILNNNKSYFSFGTLRDIFNSKAIKKIIITGFDIEPYICSTSSLLDFKNDEILEILSYLGRIFKTEANIIVLKNSDRVNIEKYSNILGTFPEINISLIPDIYPITNEVLKNYINFNIEDTLIINPEIIWEIYNVLKKDKNTTEKFLTITGNAIENPILVNAKIGSSVKKIVEENVRFITNEEVNYIVNGLMCGNNIEIDNLIVTDSLNGIIINFKEEYEEIECVNCGKCIEICPVGINPKACFIEAKINNDKCINCGLCTYICPAYINFKKHIKELKNEK